MKRLLMSAAASLVLAGAFVSPALAQEPQHNEHHDHGANTAGNRGGQPNGGNRGHLSGNSGDRRSFSAAPQSGRNIGGGQPRGEQHFGQASPAQPNRTFAQNGDRGRDARGFTPDHRNDAFRARDDHRDGRIDRGFDQRDFRGGPSRFAGDWRSHRWGRGEYLGNYARFYVDLDWRRWRLAPPAYGCRYVEDDFGDILLVDIATGMILQVIAAG